MWSQNGRPWELSKLSYQDEDCHVWFMRLVSCNPQLSTLPSCWVSRFFFANIKGTGVNMSSRYCWWKKSCTTWDVKSHVNNGINYQPQLVSHFWTINRSFPKYPKNPNAQLAAPSFCSCAPAACAAPALAGALAGWTAPVGWMWVIPNKWRPSLGPDFIHKSPKFVGGSVMSHDSISGRWRKGTIGIWKRQILQKYHLWWPCWINSISFIWKLGRWPLRFGLCLTTDAAQKHRSQKAKEAFMIASHLQHSVQSPLI